MSNRLNIDTRAPGTPVAHWFDRYGHDIGPVPGAAVPAQTYALDSVGKQSRAVQLGRAYVFDGVDDTVTFPSSSLFFTNNIEVEFWWIPTNVASFKAIYFVGQDGTSGQAGGWYVEQSASGATAKLRYAFRTSPTTNLDLYLTNYTYVVSTTYLINIKLTPTGGNSTLVTVTTTPYNGLPVIETYTVVNPIVWPSVVASSNTKLTFHAGKVWGFKCTNLATGALILLAKCDEQYGNTSYDSSGNALHGTIANHTQATFHGTQNIYSYQNEGGYNFAGEIYNEQFNVAAVAAASNPPRTLQGWTMTNADGSAFTATLALNGTALVLAETVGAFTLNVYLVKVFTIVTAGWYRLTAIITNPGTSTNIYWRWADHQTLQVNQQTGTMNCYGYLPAGGRQFVIIPQGGGYQLTIDSITVTQVSFTPRNEAVPTLDALGGALTYAGRVKYNALLKQSYSATFSGGQYVTASIPANIQGIDFIICGWIWKTRNGQIEYALQLGPSGSGNKMLFEIRWVGDDRIHFRTYNGVELGVSSTPWTNTTTPFYFVAYRDNSSGNSCLYINGTLYTNTTNLTPPAADLPTYTTLNIGRRLDNALYFQGRIAGFQYAPYNAANLALALQGKAMGNLIAHYPMAEGGGLLHYDTSGNANHGSIQNATLATYWGTKQDYFHYNALNGFNKPTYINETFPANVDNWGVYGGTPDFSYFNDSGNGVLKVVRQSVPSICGLALMNSNAIVGITYKVTYKIKVVVAGGASANGNIYFRAKIGLNQNTVIGGTTVNVGSGWTTQTFTYTAVDTSGFSIFSSGEAYAVAIGDTWYIDDVVIISDAYIPAKITNPLQDVFGFAIANPSPGRALIPAETQVDFTGAVASPFALQNGMPSAYTFGGTNFPSKGNAYYETGLLREKNFLVYGMNANSAGIQMSIRRFIKTEPKIWLWYDAGQVVKDGGNFVSQLIDLSGQKNNALQATSAAQPQYVANQLNGCPILRFDGVDDCMLWNSSMDIRNKTFFIVFKANVLMYYSIIVGLDNPQLYGNNNNTSDGYMRQWNRGANQLEHATFEAGYLNKCYDTVYQRGVQCNPVGEVAVPGASVYPLPVTITSFSYYRMFNNYPNEQHPYALARNFNNNTFMPMDFAEMMIVDGLITLNQAKSIETYFKIKYALP